MFFEKEEQGNERFQLVWTKFMNKAQVHIIIASQDVELVRQMERIFPRRTCVTWEPNLDRVLGRFEDETFDVLVITGGAFQTGKVDGIELLEVIATQSPVTQILFLAYREDLGIAMSALKAGSYQYARLPVGDEELKLLAQSAMERQPQGGMNRLLKAGKAEAPYEEIAGKSEVLQEVYNQIRQAAATDIPVLLQGETGTGKDLVAKAIHRESARSTGPFVPVNLGAVPSELVGSELFGHEKGAFTGALEQRAGKFEMGNHGSVFLDEIGTIDEKVQVSLLRLIEQKKLHRLGGRKLFETDVRLIASTNEELSTLVQLGKFREDLFYRLDVFRISLPPLRQRQGDILLLVEEFLRRYGRSFQKNIHGVSPECAGLLDAYEWPGNIRELKNVIQRAVLVCEGNELGIEHLPPRFRKEEAVRSTVTFEVGTPLHEVEREMVVQALSATRNNRKRAAELLGISRRSLYNKLHKHGIN